MPLNLALKDMTLQEKLAAMELLWDDLACSPETIEPPTWYKDILDINDTEAFETVVARFFHDWERARGAR
jgi:hypothetical protein